jgi:hypothetical protein
MGRRINTIMQTCFFAISGILPKDEAIAAIKQAVDKTYGRKSKRWSISTTRRSTPRWRSCTSHLPQAGDRETALRHIPRTPG